LPKTAESAGLQIEIESYDLGVDIELHDALQRHSIEHPEIRAVVITSAKNRIFVWRQHLYAGAVFARVEVKFLQIYE